MNDLVWGDQNEAMRDVLQTKPTSIEEVLEKMEAVKNILSKVPDSPTPLLAFNVLYHKITSMILDEYKDGGFQEPDFLVALDIRFGRRYFDALLSWTTGAGDTPRCWSVLFAKRASDRIADMQGMIAGVACHICYDLSAALVDTFSQLGLDPGPDGKNLPRQRKDYDKIDQIFYEAIPALRRSAYTAVWQTILDAACGNLDDHLDGLAVDGSRALAWRESATRWALRSDPAAGGAYDHRLDSSVVVMEHMLFVRGIGRLFLREPMGTEVERGGLNPAA